MKIIKSIRCTYDSKSFNSVCELKAYKILKKILPDIEIIVNKCIYHSRKQLDFYMPSFRLGIEIQGLSHNDNFYNILKDIEKYLFFKKLGVRVIYIAHDKITQKYLEKLLKKYYKNE